MKNIAMTPMSQKMKNRNRLAEVNSPTEAIWNITISADDTFGFSFSGLPAITADSSTMEDIKSSMSDTALILKLRLIMSDPR